MVIQLREPSPEEAAWLDEQECERAASEATMIKAWIEEQD